MIGMDKAKQLKSMIRVNQAGEFGAKRIYAGQLAIMGDRHPAARSISHMAEQEARHLDAFDRIMAERAQWRSRLKSTCIIRNSWKNSEIASRSYLL
jgi:demethoxyubiquinone hydroxylase (CLK1/Coq7/Cat5 family)